MTADQIVEAFRAQMEHGRTDLPQLVMYITRRPFTWSQAKRFVVSGEPDERMTISIRTTVYDVDAMLKEFQQHVFVGFNDDTRTLPIIDNIDLYIV